jgi:cob(I)alamin adenosyltransferase
VRGEFEGSGNGKTGPNTFSVVKDRQNTKPAEVEFTEPGLVRKDGRLYARVRGDGILVGRSAGTANLKLAREWNKRWERRQHLIHKEPNQA